MLKISKFAVFAVLTVITASAYADEAPAAVVNGVAISKKQVDMQVDVAAAQGKPDTPELRKSILNGLISNEVVVQEAVKNGLDKQPNFLEQLDKLKQELLVRFFVQDFVKSHPLSDEAIAIEYDKLKKALGDKKYLPRHILVGSEKEAKSIKAKLKKGSKFATLAKRYSKDTGSKDNGGELGWIPVGKIPVAFVKPFGDALMKLSKGQVSDPVQSRFGWHIIQLEDVQDYKMPTIEEAKPRITQVLHQEAINKEIASLREKAKITE